MKHVITLAAVLSLAGCSTGSFLKSTEPVPTIYNLRASSDAGDVTGKTARVVEVAMPSVPPGMDGDRIALFTDSGRKLDYYAGARWPEPLDQLIQEFTRRSITTRLPYVVAVTPGQSVGADYRLDTKINEFQPIYQSDINIPPAISVNVEFTLMRLPEETIVRSFSLAKSAEASSARLDVIAAGLEKMLQEIETEAFDRMDQAITMKPKS